MGALSGFGGGSSATITVGAARGGTISEVHGSVGVDDCNVDQESVVTEVGGRGIWKDPGGD